MNREQQSISMLKKHLDTQLDWLAVLREYQQNIIDPHVKSALTFVIEDTQDVIAMVSSRLRQLGTSTGEMDQAINYRRLYQSRARRDLGGRIRFVWQGLKYDQEWYERGQKELQDDSDSLAMLAALSEQTQKSLERWERMMAEMKVSTDE